MHDPPVVGGLQEPPSDGGEQDPAVVGPLVDRPPGGRSDGPPAPTRRSLRDRVGREAMGVAVLVLLTVVCAALIATVVVKTQNDAAAAAREASAYTPPPFATPASAPASSSRSSSTANRSAAPSRSSSATRSPAATSVPTARTPVGVGVRIAVIGDGSVTTASSEVGAAQQWPALLRSDLHAALNTAGSSGAGYTTAGGGGETFAATAAYVPRGSDVVVFIGGSADVGASTLQLATAATAAYSQVSQRAPGVRIVVVGPLTADGATPAQLQQVRNALRGAARIAGARFVDPITAGWVPSGAATPSALTAQDERVVAAKLRTLVVAE